MKGPVHHIIRAKLPWRDEPDTTECGHLASEMAQVWTREQAVTQFKELGVQRFVYVVCMNCKDTANRWSEWEDNPISVMERECQRAGWRWGPTADETSQLERELRALAALAEAHVDEFQAMVSGLAETANLAARRAARRRLR